MFKAASIFSIVSAGRRDVLALDNPIKEMDTWKWKYETMELRCYTLQEEVVVLQEKVKTAKYLQEEEKIHNYHSTLVAQVIKMEDSLKEVDKWY